MSSTTATHHERRARAHVSGSAAATSTARATASTATTATATTATATTTTATTAPSARPAPSDAPGHEERRWVLGVVRPAPRRTGLSKGRLVLVAPVLVLVSLLAVASAQALLTQGQVRLTSLQAQVSAAQTKRFDLELQIAREEQPSAVIAAARAQGMIVPSVINDIPAVSLVSPRPAKRASEPPATRSTAAKNGLAPNRISGHP